MAWNEVAQPILGTNPVQNQTASYGKPHVKCCIPHFGNVSLEWARTVLTPLEVFAQPDFDKSVLFMRGILNLDVERNMLVKEALKDPLTTHILFVDSDMIPEQDINQSIRMLLQCNNSVASGLYRAKQKEGFNYAMWMRNPTGGIGYIPIQEWTGNWIRTDVIGFGFVLLRRECFERISYPWFEWGEPSPSEDFVYSEKLNKAGYQIRVLTSVKFSHVGQLKVTSDGKIGTLGI
jgi:hypothetical protein